MKVNSLLFSSYSLKMYKTGLYDQGKIVKILDNYPIHQDKSWIILSKNLVKGTN